MKTYRLTAHAEERITHRLGNLVTSKEVIKKVSERGLPKGRSYMQIKRMQYTEVADPDVKPDGIARGDQIVAVVDDEEITTVILRKSYSQSGEYRKIYH